MKLQPLLTEYLIEHSDLLLSGAGRLSITHTAATFSDNESSLLPPTNSIAFSSTLPTENEQQEVIQFIRFKLNISDQQAITLQKEEGNWQSTFAGNERLNWPPLGSFQKVEEGAILFTPTDTWNKYLPAISVAPIVRHQEVEIVAQERVEEPVDEFIEPEKRDNWWIWVIVLFVISVTLILIRYYNIY